ncbi:unnamed protein product, partial [marine sediment metagenome]
IISGNTYQPDSGDSGNVDTHDLENDGTITANGNSFTIEGSWDSVGTFTGGTSTVTFDGTGGSETLVGTMTGASAFNKLVFNASAGGWTIQDAIKVAKANGTDTLLIQQGTVTLGDGTGDNLEVNGKMVVGSASSTATFQTMDSLPEGDSIIIDVNNYPSPADCANCVINVGTTTNGDPQGTFTLNENAILRLNSYSSVQSGLEVLASGKLNLQGQLVDSSTTTASTAVTRICDTTGGWSDDDYNGEHVRISDTYANTTSSGEVHEILDTIASDASCSNNPSLI